MANDTIQIVSIGKHDRNTYVAEPIPKLKLNDHDIIHYRLNGHLGWVKPILNEDQTINLDYDSWEHLSDDLWLILYYVVVALNQLNPFLELRMVYQQGGGYIPEAK